MSSRENGRDRAREAGRERIAWLFAAVWLAGASGALGYFMFEDRRAFEPERVSLFDARERARAAEAWFRERHAPLHRDGAVTVVNVSRPACGCNRYANTHRAKIAERFGRAGVRFVDTELPSGLSWVDATPAALVFDARGSLAYFGPYSSAAWCGLGGGLVEPVLERLLRGEPSRPEPFYGSGCFCAGPTNV